MLYLNGVPVGWQALEFYHIARTYAEREEPWRQALLTVQQITKRSPAGNPSKPWRYDDLEEIVHKAYEQHHRRRREQLSEVVNFGRLLNEMTENGGPARNE
jgi:iron-sulfur cluster repair protein YtfE (RIC family)